MLNASPVAHSSAALPLRPQFKKLLLWAALIAAGIELIPTALFAALYLLRQVVPPEPLAILYLPYYLLALIFADPIRYLLLHGVVLALIIAALVWTNMRSRGTIWLIAGIVALIAQAAIYSNYQPPIQVREGHQMMVATQPATFMERITKQGQVTTDVRPCVYQLLGWNSDERFYYQSMCGNEVTQWAFQPGSGIQASEVASTPNDLTAKIITFSTVFEYMTFPGFDPNVNDVYHFASFLDTNQLRQSPDGKWIAAVTEHFYGPQDVVLVQVED